MVPLLLIIIPSFLASIYCIAIYKKNINLMHIFAVIMSIFTAIITLYITYLFVEYDQVFSLSVGKVFGSATIDLKTTGRSMIFCSMVAILYPLALIYAICYARINKMENQATFFCFFHLAIMFGLAFGLSANLITMFIFYEMITLATYPLVVHNRDVSAKRSGRIYLTHLIASASLLFLPAIIIIQATIGSTDFVEGGIFSGYKISITSVNILFAMMIFGIAKSAIFPLHNWLPSAMVAPTPVSAILHAVVVVKSGLFALISVIYFIFGPDLLQKSLFTFYHENWLTWLSAGTILIMSLMAIFQDNIKKRLAYSTISQLSYAILAASMLSKSAMKVAMLLMVAHAFSKIILFFGAGIIHSCFHKDRLSQIYGIGKQIPITMGAICIACISLIGLPITIGFIAKYQLLLMVIKYQNIVIILIIVASTLLSVLYLFPFIYNTLFAKNEEIAIMVEPLPKAENIMFSAVMIICSVMVMVLFFANGIIYKIISQ